MPQLASFPKQDAHFHANVFDPAYLRIAKAYSVRYLTINTDTAIFPPLEEQEAVALEMIGAYPTLFDYITSFSMKHWQESGWQDAVIRRITHSVAQGAVGVKIWKNIGMEIRKPDGSFLMADDAVFDPIYRYLRDNAIPVLAHLGEPRNCWLPLEAMTTDRNRNYYKAHPEFHAYLHPEIPGYEAQLAARDRVLEKYPGLVFVGAHLGSMEWSVEEIAKRLDRYPNFQVDLSSRIGHLQLQSLTRYEAVREFMLQYADRIMYGSDAYDNPAKLEAALVNDWTFLATEDDGPSPEVAGTFRGLGLPEEVLYQIYFSNAHRIYSRLGAS